MYLKIKGVLSLMEKQQNTFDDTYFNLLFESFLPQDILNGSDLPEELDFAERIKKYTKEYKDSIAEKNYRIVKGAVDRLIFNEHKVISEIMAKYQMPSILSNIPDDPEEVLNELLKLHGYQHLLEYKKSDSAE